MPTGKDGSEPDSLLAMLAHIGAGVQLLVEKAEGEARAYHQLGGEVPCKVVEIRTGDPFDRSRGGISVHWTPVGLLVYENGKRLVTRDVQLVFETVSPTQRWR